MRLNQLNYFERIEADKAAEIKRNTKDGTVDITLKLKEKGKQSIGLQGGVSGLAGTFIGLTYQTNNFLGLGETLTLLRAVRRSAAQLHFWLHRALSLRPADLHGLHDFRKQVQF